MTNVVHRKGIPFELLTENGFTELLSAADVEKVLAEKLYQAADVLLKEQYGDGTLDAGGNRQSPPDTAFILEYIFEK